MQPFGQIPTYRDEEVAIFESGAIVLRIAERAGKLIPADAAGRMQALQWLAAALSSVEPFVMALAINDIFRGGPRMVRSPPSEGHRRTWGHGSTTCKPPSARRNGWTGRRSPWGDLTMVSVLGGLRNADVLAGFPRLAAYVARGEERPADRRAMADHIAARLHPEASRHERQDDHLPVV